MKKKNKNQTAIEERIDQAEQHLELVSEALERVVEQVRNINKILARIIKK